MSLTPSEPVTGRQPPLTLAVRLATFLVLIQCLAWLAAGVVWLNGTELPREPPAGLTVLPIRHPPLVGAINVLTALILGWWQYRAVLTRARLSAPLVGLAFLLLGLLTCLPHEATPEVVVVGLTQASIGGVMLRWAWRLWRTPRRR